MRRLVMLCAAAAGLTLLSVAAWTQLWPEPDLAALPRADAILCLGGGLAADGRLPRPVQARVARCVEVQRSTGTPLVVFTGGTRAADGTRAAHVMAAHALSLGLPGGAVLHEARSRSTLQNALYSLQIAPRTDRLIVVTEAFHLPRAGASVRWAAWALDLPQPRLSLVMSKPVRRGGGRLALRVLVRESAALWFNLARAAAFSAVPGAPERWLD